MSRISVTCSVEIMLMPPHNLKNHLLLITHKDFFGLTLSGERSKIAEIRRSIQQRTVLVPSSPPKGCSRGNTILGNGIVGSCNCSIMVNVAKLAWIPSSLRSSPSLPVPPQNRLRNVIREREWSGAQCLGVLPIRNVPFEKNYIRRSFCEQWSFIWVGVLICKVPHAGDSSQGIRIYFSKAPFSQDPRVCVFQTVFEALVYKDLIPWSCSKRVLRKFQVSKSQQPVMCSYAERYAWIFCSAPSHWTHARHKTEERVLSEAPITQPMNGGKPGFKKRKWQFFWSCKKPGRVLWRVRLRHNVFFIVNAMTELLACDVASRWRHEH